MMRLPPFVDLIVLGEGEKVDFYARNPQGLHVPISALSVQQRHWAYAAWNVRDGTMRFGQTA